MARFDGIAVYMMSNKQHGVIYIGVTSDLLRRNWQHRAGVGSDFTTDYSCWRLVWFEMHDDMRVAIQREKSLKRWLRAWKISLIERENPDWRDLWPEIQPGRPLDVPAVTPEQLLRGEVGDPRVKPEDDTV